ncbi:craniofacial development protein 1-like [Watersipora subatra]|uniref:craniofacial development protein 1-like n=1 Tax=Watersipora subatra TaxID=2589382 RepID=UPI00355BC32D
MSRYKDETPAGIPLSHAGSDDDDDESDDDDYVPSEHEVSEEENSGEDEDLTSVNDSTSSATRGKRRKTQANKNPRLARSRQADEENIELQKQIVSEQAANKEQKEKEHADSLWASFMSDVGSSKTKSQTKTNEEKSLTMEPKHVGGTSRKPAGSISITKVFDFAGETVRVEKQVSADSKEAKKAASEETTAAASTGLKRPGGLGAVLGFINKKQKISTLDKSKLDWEKYKAEAGLSHELKNHTNSKASYLERKEFLERADQRQFEKERNARLASVSKR